MTKWKFVEDPLQQSRAQMKLYEHVCISSNKNLKDDKTAVD